MEASGKTGAPATLGQSISVFVFLAISLIATILLFGGSPHVPLLCSTAFAAVLGIYNRVPWSEMQHTIASTYADAAGAILVMLLIGMIIGTWIAGGIVPALIFYGLKVLSPDHLLLATCLICSIVSLAIGSSWTTIGTVGLALAGIGLVLGINPAMTAGAIISGAYFGDKMSPLSDTTNLAPAVVGVDLFEHIRHMVYTTGPAYILALAAFAVIDFAFPVADAAANVGELSEVLSNEFVISPLLLLVPVITAVLIGMRTPALPSLFIIGLLGAICAVLVQDAEPSSVVAAMNDGYRTSTGFTQADELLNRGGIQSMMWTVSLILIGLAFAGVVERTGVINTVARSILAMARSAGGLIFATIVTTAFTALTTAVQYVALIIPGRLYRDVYPRFGLHRKNLSRAIEDSGTVTAPLVPWSTDGAFIMGVLGVSTAAYLPYAFFNLLSPIVSAIAGFTGYTISPASDDSAEKADAISGGID